jgi:hypothetical protein
LVVGFGAPKVGILGWAVSLLAGYVKILELKV